MYLAALDLDGTLLNSAGEVSERSRKALQAWTNEGHFAVVVTARPARWLRDLAREFDGIAVCSNGAATYDFATGKVERIAELAVEVIAQIVDVCASAIPGLLFSLEEGTSCYLDHAWEESVSPPDELHRIDVRTGSYPAMVKVKLRHPSLPVTDLIARVAPLLPGQFEISHSGAHFVEIAPAGVTKAAGLERVCVTHGIAPSSVFAFGDMPNDIPMLEWAGRGVAMANADPTVLAMADDITASNDDDGVAIFLEAVLSS